jgi:hypothetical protein
MVDCLTRSLSSEDDALSSRLCSSDLVGMSQSEKLGRRAKEEER